MIVTLLLTIGINISLAFDKTDITDMVFKMSGRSEKTFEYKFSKGDTIVLKANVQKGNSISKIEVTEWPSSIRFQAYDVKEIVDKKITVNKTNVYLFKIKNEAILKSQTYSLKIQRIPSSQDNVDFNTNVSWDTTYDTAYVACIETTLIKIDTIPEEIVNTQLKLGTQLSGNTRSYVKITLPENTSSWAYWIGVGQEAADGLQKMTNALPKAAGVLFTNPLFAFAGGLIPELFSMNKGLDVSYYFIADYDNLCNFMNGQTFYQFKCGQKIITDYAKMEPRGENTFYLGLDNSYSVMTSKLVNVHIVALKTIPKCEYKDVKKPKIIPRVTPHLID